MSDKQIKLLGLLLVTVMFIGPFAIVILISILN